MNQQHTPTATTTAYDESEQHTAEAKLRSLHVLISEDAYRTARKAAIDSGLSFRAYITQLLNTAKPFPPNEAA